MDSEFLFSEYAKGSANLRGHIDTTDAIRNFALHSPNKIAVYESVFKYTESIRSYVSRTGSVAGYTGKRYCECVYIDMDASAYGSSEALISAAKRFSRFLDDEGAPVQFYFSGRGFHAELSTESFGIEASDTFNSTVGQAVDALCTEAKILYDASLYTPTSLIRCNGSVNGKSDLFKIPLTTEELFLLDYESICDLAKTKRIKFRLLVPEGSGELARFVDKSVKHTVDNDLKVKENSKIATCIHTIWNRGPIEGTRHEVLLRIASFMRRQGVPFGAALAGITDWIGEVGRKDRHSFTQTVRQVYDKGYQYSCADKIMARNCSTKCVFYKHKNLQSELYDSEEMHQELLRVMLSDRTGRSINISPFVSSTPSEDWILMPGDMLTIFGPTGTNKTALAQNILLGYDPNTDTFNQDNTVRTLYLSLELSAAFMHKRNLQILGNLTKNQMRNINTVNLAYETFKDQLSHIKVQTVSPTIADIKAKVLAEKPACLIVDYIDLIDTGKTEYEHVRLVSKELRNLSTNEGFITILLSQISRAYAREAKLDAYAGKGGGQIENSSSLVLGINNPTGDKDRPERTLELFKYTEGALSSRNLFFSPSYRLKTERTT